MTLAGHLRPAVRAWALTFDLGLVLAGSLLIATSAQFAVPLPFSPVPVTGQTFAVLLVGALLGSRLGTASILAYLAEGAAGLPFFTGGAGGALHLAGPTGGYLLGFVAGAWVVGSLIERGWGRDVTATVAALVVGDAVIFAVGALWLAAQAGFMAAVVFGIAPFLVGEAAKIGLAMTLVRPVGAWISRRG